MRRGNNRITKENRGNIISETETKVGTQWTNPPKSDSPWHWIIKHPHNKKGKKQIYRFSNLCESSFGSRDVAPDVILFVCLFEICFNTSRYQTNYAKKTKKYTNSIYSMPTLSFIVKKFVSLFYLLSFVFESRLSSCWCNFVFSVVVEERISHSGFASPWEDLRTRLTGAHVADARFMPSVTHFGGITPLRPLLDVSNIQLIIKQQKVSALFVIMFEGISNWPDNHSWMA